MRQAPLKEVPVASQHGKPLFVDLTSVSFIDGRGFRVLSRAAQAAATAGCR